MSSNSEADDRRMKRERVLFVIIALVLIFNFVRRLFPVAERSGSAENILTVLTDLGMAVGLVGLGVRILKAIPRGSEGRGKWVVLLVAGSIAAAGIFMIHASGGPRVELPPRAVNSAALVSSTIRNNAVPSPGSRRSPESESTPTRADPQRFLMILELKNLIEAGDQRFAELETTRWARLIASDDRALRRTLTREDLRQFVQKHRPMLDSTDQGLAFFAKAEAKKYSFEDTLDGDPRSKPEAWRVYRAFVLASENYHSILVRNWDEYRTNGANPKEGQAKSWQEEALQAKREMESRHKELMDLHQK